MFIEKMQLIFSYTGPDGLGGRVFDRHSRNRGRPGRLGYFLNICIMHGLVEDYVYRINLPDFLKNALPHRILESF